MGKDKKNSTKKSVAEKKPVCEIMTSLPQNVMKIGGMVEENKNIYISQSAYKAIHNFTKDKLENESGGMLMGYTLDGAGKTNIIIDGFIEGKYCQATPTTLTFTHETWDYVNAEADKKYPEYKIIGWIHTHPSFGIFLSEYDKFIQQNFFNGDNQIAYVVDPIQKIEGFYFWIDGKIEKCNGFYIYEKTGVPIIIEQESKEKEEPVAIVPEKKWKDYALIATTALSAILLFAIMILNSKISDMNRLEKALLSEQTEYSQQIQILQNQINSVKQSLSTLTDKGDEDKFECKIIFVADDGTKISEAVYSFGDKIKAPESPTKKSDVRYDYVFAGWNEEPNIAKENSIYTALFTPVEREYTVVFKDVDGEIISTAKYHYGDTIVVPEYSAEKESEEPLNYKYVLSWDKTVASVTGNETYTAVFEKEYVTYTVVFKRDDGSIIQEKKYHYNDKIEIEEPSKEPDDTYTYSFSGWDREFTEVTEDTEYIAQFTQTEKTPPEGEETQQ